MRLEKLKAGALIEGIETDEVGCIVICESRGEVACTVYNRKNVVSLRKCLKYRADKFIPALMIIDGESHEGPYYTRKPFTQELDWAVTSISLDIASLLQSIFKQEIL